MLKQQFSNVTIQQLFLKTADDPRHLARQKIVQELFAWDAQTHLKQESEGKTPKESLDAKTREIIDLFPKINQIINECAPEWDIPKINQVDLAILQLAIYELIDEAVEPSKVILDEAVELAKEFGTENSPAFINGALGKVLYQPQRIKKIISLKLGVEEDKITDESDLYSDLNCTELEISDLITNLEKEYNFILEPGIKINKISDLIEIIDEQNE